MLWDSERSILDRGLMWMRPLKGCEPEIACIRETLPAQEIRISPIGFATSSSCEPCSMMTPCCTTAITSASLMVDRRWACVEGGHDLGC